MDVTGDKVQTEYEQLVPCGACMTLFKIDTRKGVPYQAYCPACEDLSNFYIRRREETK